MGGGTHGVRIHRGNRAAHRSQSRMGCSGSEAHAREQDVLERVSVPVGPPRQDLEAVPCAPRPLPHQLRVFARITPDVVAHNDTFCGQAGNSAHSPDWWPSSVLGSGMIDTRAELAQLLP
jgi:hypothetical protein